MAATIVGNTPVFATSASSKTVTHAVSAGSNRLLIMMVSMGNVGEAVVRASSVVRNGTKNFTELTAAENTYDGGDMGNVRHQIFYLLEADFEGGSLDTVLTASGTFDWLHASLVEVKDGYQGAPVTYSLLRGEDDTGPFSDRLLNTQSGGLILCNTTLINPTPGSLLAGDQPAIVAPVVLTSTHGGASGGLGGYDAAVGRAMIYALRSGASASALTTLGFDWEHVTTSLEISVDWFAWLLEIKTDDWVPPAANFPTANLCAYVSRGQARKMVTSVTGLTHLEGEVVQAQVDGILPTGTNAFTVSGGAITLPEQAAVVHVGLPYTGKIQILPDNSGSPTGTAITKMRNIYLATLRVFRSLSFKIGPSESNLNEVVAGTPALPLLTEDIEKAPPKDWSQSAGLWIVQDRPLPLFILSAILRSEVEDR